MLEQRLRKVECRPELLRFLRDGVFQKRNRGGGVLNADQADSDVELGFVQCRLQLERGFILRDRLRILAQQTIRQRQMKVSGIILGIGRSCFAEQLHRGSVLLRVESLDSVGLKIRRLGQQSRHQKPHHRTPIVSVRDFEAAGPLRTGQTVSDPANLSYFDDWQAIESMPSGLATGVLQSASRF
jgi:hypothetical protein